ncbi:MAG: phosphodiester glycosidase family protein [Clostridia bacterium]|nr:phosphodiester glycosidase family protein [Clostridia bacterium]
MKRIISLLIFTVIIITSLTSYSAPIYTSEEIIPISKSITLTKVKGLYADHNISYSYIKADLNDKNTSLKLLKSPDGTDRFETVTNLAKTEKDTVAALNADFFSVHSGSKGFSLGIEIKDGNLLQSPINPDTMATVSYTDSTLAMSYLDFHIMAVAPNGNYHEVRHLNKHTTYYGDILMYTSDFNGGNSPAPGGEVVEVVVSDGVITEFRRKMPSVKIPENGCVLVVSEGMNMFLANNFSVGDKIKFDYYITPDIQNVQTAMGGGAMLVTEGKIPSKFSHNIAGYNPRSAIGMSRDGKTLYLVAVDGRQTSSRGMTMSELAQLMKDLGCYNAVNLDGGGSTNMVASTVTDEDMKTVNSPTENRKVINAVGISYESSNNTPAGIILTPDKDTVFIGDKVQITPTVYDENMRPATGKVTLSSVHGTINENTLTPNTGGNIQINASCENASGILNIFVIDKITGIEVPSYMSLDAGQSKSIDIKVFDGSGHYASVSNTTPFYITSSDTSVVSVSGSKLTAHKNGTAIITVAKDGAASYISVCVGGKDYQYTETFEHKEGSFSSYPANVPGDFVLTDKKAFSGKKSGYLSFDFTEENDTTKAVYYNLDTKRKLDTTADIVSLYLYSDNEFKHSIRAQFTDSAGTVHRVVMGKNLEGGKWHNLDAIIPEKAAKPVTLDKIYAVYVAGEERDSGGVYIDNLSYTLTTEAKYEAAPANIYSEETDLSSENKVFRVGALVKNPTTLISGLVNSNMSSGVSSVGSNALLGALKPFSSKEDSNALYITLNTSKGGIRATDSSQWNKLANAIYESSKENVFVISDYSLFGKDSFENEAIKGYLEKLNKNIFVITAGDKNTYKNENGVKYFTLCNTEKDALSQQRMNNYKYLEFYFAGEVTFAWKNLY